MEELQDRELGPEDYDLLLSLENKKNLITLPKHLAMAIEKAMPPPKEYFDAPQSYCVFCEGSIADRSKGL